MKLDIKSLCMRYLIPLCIILVTVLCLFFFRSIPVNKIWNGYRVMYVDKTISENTVLSYLEKAGCKGVITFCEQRIPISSIMLDLSLQFSESKYLENRLKYFTDQNNEYRLFYIPDVYESMSIKALRSLVSDTKCKAGLDEQSNFPWVVPIVCFVVFILLTLVSSRRAMFAFPTISSIIFSFSMPFYVIGSTVCLYLFAWFLANRLWGRTNDIKAICRNFYIITLTFCFIFVSFTQSFLCGLLSVFVIIQGIAIIYILKDLKLQKDKKSSFNYFLIFNADQMPVMYKKNSRYLIYLTVPIFTLFVGFIFSAKFAPKSSLKTLNIPMPVESTDNLQELPSLSDYFIWAWNTITFPYQSLNENYNALQVTENSKVVVPNFVQSDSEIIEKNTTTFVYDKAFTDGLEKDIINLDYPAIEKLLEKQGKNTHAAYTTSRTTGKSTNDFVNLLLLLVCLCIPLILYVTYYNIGRRKI